MIRSKSEFIGKSSIGFINGMTYGISIANFGNLKIETTEGLRCEYSSVDKFLENWKIISLDIKNDESGIVISSISNVGISSIPPSTKLHISNAGVAGSIGITGYSGTKSSYTGTSGYTGISGTTGISGHTGTIGVQGFNSNHNEVVSKLRTNMRNNKLENLLSE